MTIPLYLLNARPSFAPTPGADVATIKAPDGSELLAAFGEPLLFVPSGHRTRMATTASQAWHAARLGERGFAMIRKLKRQGQSLEAIGRAVGLSRGRVCTLWKRDQLRRLAESR
jgi:hypothetical protein